MKQYTLSELSKLSLEEFIEVVKDGCVVISYDRTKIIPKIKNIKRVRDVVKLIKNKDLWKTYGKS